MLPRHALLRLRSARDHFTLVCLAGFAFCVYNPFVMDYLVTASGYSLALGFLLAAIATLARNGCQ